MKPSGAPELESLLSMEPSEPAHVPETTSSPALARRLFLDFVYPETKDVMKHYLTLVGGTIALEAAFGERFLGVLQGAHWLTWGAFFISILLQLSALGNFALGLRGLLRAGEHAKAADLRRDDAEDWRPHRRRTMVHLEGGLWAYWLGLATLAAAWLASAM